MTTLPNLKETLQAASYLAGTSKPPNRLLQSNGNPPAKLADILRFRLAIFSDAVPGWMEDETVKRITHTSESTTISAADEKQLQLLTAVAALYILLQLQKCEQEDKAMSANKPSTSKAIQAAPTFGMRDVNVIQTLASIMARWGTASVIDHGILPPDMQDKEQRIVTLKEDDTDEKRNTLLRYFAESALMILVRPAEDRNEANAFWAVELQTVTLPHLLLPTLAAILQLQRTGCIARDAIDRLLWTIPPSTAMAALFALLSSSSASRKVSEKTWLPSAVSALLSRQLIRPGGILGLLNVLLGRSEGEPQMQQLEQVARLIITPPTHMETTAYYALVLPRILGILQPASSGQTSPPSYLRALCFCISRLIETLPDVVRQHLLPRITLQAENIEDRLEMLNIIVSNIDPSPTNYAFLLTPNVTSLLSMYLFIQQTKADPLLRQAVANLLNLWGRTLDEEEVVESLCIVVKEEDALRWRRTESGSVAYVGLKESGSSDELGGFGDSMLELRPNPQLLVSWLKQLARKEIIVQLLIRWLGESKTMQRFSSESKSSSFSTQKHILLRLQLMLQIIEQCGSEIVHEPPQTLIFIDHALERTEKRAVPSTSTTSTVNATCTPTTNGLSLGDLRIADYDDHDDEVYAAEEDVPEFPELEGIAPQDQLVLTGITLLLSVLEVNENLDFNVTPVLGSIDAKLRDLVEHPSEVVGRLARDARTILSLRREATRMRENNSCASKDPAISAERQIYLDALRLLQDPILPVRAQGLSMLRSLVTGNGRLFAAEPALVPAILEIFVQAIQDDDSFLYLNAVQGLSSMADVFGAAIAKRLVRVYLGKDPDYVGDGEPGRRELDKRLRVGEALVQITQRAATALAKFIDILLPPLLHVVRTRTLPVALRTSGLAIISTCVEVAPLPMIPHSSNLINAMSDLLSVETRKSGQLKGKDETPEPLEVASTHPSLRRGALSFLSRLLRADASQFSRADLRRLHNVIGYTQNVDEDALVRHNAEIVMEDVETLLSP